MERFYSLKSVKGPKAQLGMVLMSTSQGLLEDLTEMLSLKKTKENRYNTNTNVDIFGQDKRKKEVLVLAVLNDGKIKIHKQANYPMFLEEINEERANEIVSRFEILRSTAGVKPKVLTPNSPDLNYYL
jgi:hypothetical protein